MKEKFTQEQKAELLRIALDAYKIHADVNQTYDDHPYSVHLENVAFTMDKYVWDCKFEEYRVLWFGALFHDSIEDARLTYNDVSKKALKYMNLEDATLATEIVYALTNEKGRTRKERANQKYYQGIRETKYAPFIKACDRMANAKYSKETGSRMYDVYKKEMPDFLGDIQSNTNEVPSKLLEDLRCL